MQIETIDNPVLQAIISRHSIRAYSDKPVTQAQIEHLLSVARYAPSGTNTQPWKVYALTGNPLQGFCEAVTTAYLDPDAATKYQEEYPYYPMKWQSPFIDRRRKVGWDLYGLLGIGKADKIESLEIKWPSGKVDKIANPPVNQYVKIVEGEGIAKAAAAKAQQ